MVRSYKRKRELTFPPHTTHRLQPLDVSVLSSFKSSLKTSFNEWLQLHPGQRISIHEIAELATVPYLNAYTPRNITSGFQKPGILPFNRNAFSNQDSLPAEVTNRPDPTQQEEATVAEGVMETTEPSQISASLPSHFVRPEQIRPLITPMTTLRPVKGEHLEKPEF